MTAGAASTICTSPLWVVKTRFMVSAGGRSQERPQADTSSHAQLQSTKSRSPTEPPPYKHTFDAFVRIMQTEGPRGFYRGLLPSLLGVSHVAVQFPLYETFKAWARESPLVMEGGVGGELPAQVILLCSSTAKMIASVLTYPHEVVRTRLQMQPRGKEERGSAAATLRGSVDSRRGYSSLARSAALQRPPRRHLFNSSRNAASDDSPRLKYSGVVRTVRTIFVEEGVRGFYNGMGVNLVRTVPSSALTILTYEVMMAHLTAPPAPSGGDEGHETRQSR